jgi:mono/diheme cytochrome c family protein
MNARVTLAAAAILVILLVGGPVLLGAGARAADPAPGAAAFHAPTDSASLAAGAKLFAKNCATCHGASGRGDGPTGRALTPRPRNFTDPKQFKSKTDEEIFKVISKGGAASKLSAAMPPWGSILKREQIWQLIGYIQTFAARDSARAPGR